MDGDIEHDLREQVRAAHANARALRIVGGASKSFYGRHHADGHGEPLRVGAHRGVVAYDPAELVITARAGTRLVDLESLLDEQHQMLGFEPPRFTAEATLGGAVSAGLAGPRRPYAGAVRDFILGVKMLNGEGETMRFGGQVMKNVAGFDIARLIAGAMGALGVVLEVSLRLVPRPQTEATVMREVKRAEAIAWFNHLASRPLPLSAAAWHDGVARVRLSASESGVRVASKSLAGEVESSSRADSFWRDLRDHRAPFFRAARMLRVSLPPADEWDCAHDSTAQCIDWGGAQRWLADDKRDDFADLAATRQAVAARGGHVIQFRGGDRCGEVFHPPPPALRALNARLKRAFDPGGILNRGRVHRDW
ncbi:MAG: glycolate oxidase subunit GlcE [bacterium]